MVRPFGVKSSKKKRKREKYDREEDFEQAAEKNEEIPLGKEEEKVDEGEGVEVAELSGIPINPSDPNARKPGVIFILENASLEIAKVGKGYQLLNADDHAHFLKRTNRNPAEYRPDICHQALLSILDSTIAKAGRLRAVYVKTQQGNLIEVKPHVRIPRTFKRFSGLMLQLLQKLSITAVGKREKLLRMIKNPVTQYLPPNTRKIGFSYSSEKLVKIRNYVDTVESDTDLVFVVGAMAHGKIETDYTDDYISVSSYPLSAAFCITSICLALADKWDIL
jgi:rRNA small subunit pseudouridine methyltransferase Nep1